MAPAATDKACGGCKALGEAVAKLTEALTGGYVERMVANEIAAFERGVEIGRGLALDLAGRARQLPPIEPETVADDPPADDDVRIVGTNGPIGDMNPR